MPNTLTEYKLAVIFNTLRQSRLFAGRPEAFLGSVAAISVIKPLGRGEHLFRAGEPLAGFYIVNKGAIKVRRLRARGREQVIQVFRPVESFAEEAMLSETGYPADACAVEPALVLLVQKEGFVDLLRRQPELVLCVLRSISRHFNRLVGLLDDLTLKDVRTRVANWILRHCPDPWSFEPQVVQLPTSKRLLASELGICSETFSRILAKLRKQKLLAVTGRTLTVRCPGKMRQLLRGRSAALERSRLGRLPAHPGPYALDATPASSAGQEHLLPHADVRLAWDMGSAVTQ